MKKIFFAFWVVVGIFFSQNLLALAGEGHDAGYEWAERHDITDTDYSNGNSESFNEGVREYAEEQANPSAEEQARSSEENDENADQ